MVTNTLKYFGLATSAGFFLYLPVVLATQLHVGLFISLSTLILITALFEGALRFLETGGVPAILLNLLAWAIFGLLWAVDAQLWHPGLMKDETHEWGAVTASVAIVSCTCTAMSMVMLVLVDGVWTKLEARAGR